MIVPQPEKTKEKETTNMKLHTKMMALLVAGAMVFATGCSSSSTESTTEETTTTEESTESTEGTEATEEGTETSAATLEEGKL